MTIAYPEHPLAGEKNIAPSRLGSEPFITREHSSGTRLAYEAFFLQQRTELKVNMELGSAVRAELASDEIVQLDVAGLPMERQ